VQAEIAVRAAPADDGRRALIWCVPVLVAVVLGSFTVAGGPGEYLVGLTFAFGTTTVALVGTVIAVRAPGNRIGAWLLVASTLITASLVMGSYAKVGQAANPPWPGAGAVAAFGNVPMVIAFILVLIWVPAIFPTGALLSRRWRILVWIVVAAGIGTCASQILGPGQTGDALGALGVITFGVGFIAGLTSVGIRYRRGSPVERQQTKWFIAATVLAVILAQLAFLITVFGVLLLTVALVAQPVAIGIAVLRYRLYAIDRIVSRTLAYILITTVLATLYVAVVLVLRAAVGGLIGDGSAEVVISTLVVAALFQRVRSRIQSSVDHRFDRRRYDAERTSTSFSEQLRDEVHLDTVAGGLLAAVGSSLAPTTSNLWLRRRVPGPR
jgi:hypothetical protein